MGVGAASHVKPSSLAAAIALALAPLQAGAVTLSPEGMGQALIYPYYTVRGAEGGVFNTYIAVTNQTQFAKVVRVRVRESRLGKEVASLNVFLSPNDMWTAAIVPTTAGAKLVTGDRSCIDPEIRSESGSDTREIVFHNRFFSPDDGAGTTLDRTREGYIEMLEMGKLTGVSATAVTHTAIGRPANCGVVQGATSLQIEPPSGGLSGTLTLMDVERGLQFGMRAEALDKLASSPYYRPPTDPYPGFDALEIDPRSTIVHEGHVYHSDWSTGRDAVSAVLAAISVMGDYVLDPVTGSRTDLVLTAPTQPFHASTPRATPPFTAHIRWTPSCFGFSRTGPGEVVFFAPFNREEATPLPESSFPEVVRSDFMCAVASVATLASSRNASVNSVLGSVSRGLGGQPVNLQFANGYLRIGLPSTQPLWLRSLATSRRIHLDTTGITYGPHQIAGLPVVGFSVQTYQKGTLHFGAAYPLKRQRVILPVP